MHDVDKVDAGGAEADQRCGVSAAVAPAPGCGSTGTIDRRVWAGRQLRLCKRAGGRGRRRAGKVPAGGGGGWEAAPATASRVSVLAHCNVWRGGDGTAAAIMRATAGPARGPQGGGG